MSVDNIVIPGGILSTWQGVQLPEDGNNIDEEESFDVVEVARQRARSLSICLDSLGPSREKSLGRLASVLRLHEANQNSLPLRPKSITDQQPRIQRPHRSTTINLGGLGRTRVTGLGTPANPGLRLDRPSSLTFLPKSERALAPAEARQLGNSYVFESLENYQLPGQQASNPPVFLARSGSNRTALLRRESSRKYLERSQTETSQISATGIVRRASVVVENAVGKVKETVTNALRRSSLQETYEKAKIRQVQLMRSDFVQLTFDYAYLPLLIKFEKEPPTRSTSESSDQAKKTQASDTALLIPCYKSENLIAATLEAALKIFPPQNIFVIANGNSPTPLDNTAAVCERYGVSHTWSPIGSKIVAQYVGCYVSKQFPYTLLIDDDCLLPPNFPIVTDRIKGKTLCIGYTIKSVGPNSTKGTLCQQAQDVEYKISGIQRAFAGKVGSATFPHGAISIWDRELLIKTFQAHPGFSVSEDWFFGHVARQLGCRIQMCTAVFVETETPTAVFFSSGGARGGFGEMTIWKQRFFRWNYFFVSGLFWDMSYIIRDWKLGWWEIGAKLFVFQEVYETLLYLLAPFVLPISFYVRPQFSGYLYLATIALYQINVTIFNYIHLRSRHESVSVLCLLYYLPYKIVLTFVNIASCYYSIYTYAKYFAKRHPKVIEDEKAVAVVLRLEEESYSKAERDAALAGRTSFDRASIPRRFTVTAVGTDLSSVAQEPQPGQIAEVDVVDFAAQLSPVPENAAPEDFHSPNATPGRMPPPPPALRRSYAWQRTTSNTSSDSNVSPFDERKRFQFPLPSSDIGVAITPPHEEGTDIPRRASPSFFRRSLPLGLSRRSSSGRRPRVRRPSGAPQPNPSLRRASSPTLPPIMLRHQSSTYSDRTFHIPTPILERPPSAVLAQSRQFVVVTSAQDVHDGWPLRNELDPARYIEVLANNGGDAYELGRRRGRLFIVDDEIEENEFEDDELTLQDGEEFEVRETL
ncbi:MAG: hypothetical protein Q9219_006811 [cf. Caloplaca sp. 3 TL-2023]